MSLEISPEIENVVRERAAIEGVSVNELLARAFAPNKIEDYQISEPRAHLQNLLARWQAEDNTPLVPPPPTRPGETPTQALFRQWREEEAHMTDPEKEAEDRLWAEIEQSLQENGRSLQMRTLG